MQQQQVLTNALEIAGVEDEGAAGVVVEGSRCRGGAAVSADAVAAAAAAAQQSSCSNGISYHDPLWASSTSGSGSGSGSGCGSSCSSSDGCGTSSSINSCSTSALATMDASPPPKKLRRLIPLVSATAPDGDTAPPPKPAAEAKAAAVVPAPAAASSSGDVVLLTGSRAERRLQRSIARAQAWDEGQDAPRTTHLSDNPPPPCNMVGRPWGAEPNRSGCHCEEFHEWLSRHQNSGRVVAKMETQDCDGQQLKIGPASFWRCGGHHMTENYWYDGKVGRIISVDGRDLVLTN